VALHMSSPEKFWQGLAAAIERPNLFEDPRFADRPSRIKHQDDLIVLMTPIFKSQSRATWCARLDVQGVPFSPVYDSSEALQDRQARHLGIQVEGRHPAMGVFRTVRFPVNFDGHHSEEVVPPPTLGEHDAAIRAQAGRIWRRAGAAE